MGVLLSEPFYSTALPEQAEAPGPTKRRRAAPRTSLPAALWRVDSRRESGDNAGAWKGRRGMIDFECPKCHEAMSVPDSLGEQSETCPACGNVTLVPPIPTVGQQRPALAQAWSSAKRRIRSHPFISVGVGVVVVFIIWAADYFSEGSRRHREQLRRLRSRIVETHKLADGGTVEIVIERYPDIRQISRHYFFANGTQSYGPVIRSGSGRSVRHGKWTMVPKEPLDRQYLWYWYGENISEGRWHELNPQARSQDR